MAGSGRNEVGSGTVRAGLDEGRALTVELRHAAPHLAKGLRGCRCAPGTHAADNLPSADLRRRGMRDEKPKHSEVARKARRECHKWREEHRAPVLKRKRFACAGQEGDVCRGGTKDAIGTAEAQPAG